MWTHVKMYGPLFVGILKEEHGLFIGLALFPIRWQLQFALIRGLPVIFFQRLKKGKGKPDGTN